MRDEVTVDQFQNYSLYNFSTFSGAARPNCFLLALVSDPW